MAKRSAPKSRPRPKTTVLTIAGSDSGGGAGIQADLKTFAALGVHGTCALTCLTAQNPAAVRRVEPVTPAMLRAQLETVIEAFHPLAIKTGMLYSAPLIRAVMRTLARLPRVPLVVDPVMIATSGARLLQPRAIRELTARLLPCATLITPNVDEASLLLGRPLVEAEDLRSAARELHQRYGCAALVKGGHLKGLNQAIDLFYDGTTELLLEAPFIRGVSTHGTGCTYAAAVTGYLGLGCPLPHAVQLAKNYITQAVAHTRRVGAHHVLEWFWD